MISEEQKNEQRPSQIEIPNSNERACADRNESAEISNSAAAGVKLANQPTSPLVQ